MTTEISILIVDDEPAWYGQPITELGRLTDVTVDWRATLADGVAATTERSYDLALLDLGLPDVRLPRGATETISAWRVFRRANPAIPLWVCTELDVEAASLCAIRARGDRVVFKRETSPAEARQIASDLVSYACAARPYSCDERPEIDPNDSEIRTLSLRDRIRLESSLVNLHAMLGGAW